MNRFLATLLLLMGLLGAGLLASACNGSPDAPENPRCAEKPDGGPCRALMLRYYYDGETGKCTQFTYRRLQGPRAVRNHGRVPGNLRVALSNG